MDEESWEKEKLQALLEAGRAATQRARSVFLIINIAGVVLLSTQFNESFSWLGNVISRPDVSQSEKQMIKEFLYKDLYSVSVPLLGLKFSVSDLSVVGSVCMAVLALWFFFVTRRENHVVAAITKEANKAIQAQNLEKASFLYYGIVHYFVFVPISNIDVFGKDRRNTTARFAASALFYIPAWALLVLAASDAASLISPSKFEPTKALWDTLDPAVQREALLRIGFCFLMILFCFKQCRDCRILDQDTVERLHKVRAAVEPDFPHSCK